MELMPHRLYWVLSVAVQAARSSDFLGKMNFESSDSIWKQGEVRAESARPAFVAMSCRRHLFLYSKRGVPLPAEEEVDLLVLQ